MKFSLRAAKSLSAYLGVYVPAAVVITIAFFFAYQFVGPPPPRTLTIATGSDQGAYYHFGQAYTEWLRQHDIELKVVETSGSAENLALLTNETAGVELAFVQGGTASDEKDLLSLGSMYYEPLWVFYRKEAPIELLSDLKGQPIAMGSDFSGTRAIASVLARENGVDPSAHPVVSRLSGRKAAEALRAGEVAAAFFVASPEAPLLQTLLADRSLALMDMDRAEAYTRRNRFLSQVHISEGLLDLEHNIPSERIQLISPTANLVIRDDLHPALIDLVLQAATAVHGDGGMFAQLDEFPTPTHLEFPLSPEAKRFYEHGPPFLQRFLPFWVATLVDRLKVLILPMIVVLIPLFKVIPPTMKWRIRRRIIRWYKEIQKLDIGMDGAEGVDQMEGIRKAIARIEHEVTQVHVPLGYAGQLYNLRMHLELVRAKLERRCRFAPSSRNRHAY